MQKRKEGTKREEKKVDVDDLQAFHRQDTVQQTQRVKEL